MEKIILVEEGFSLEKIKNKDKHMILYFYPKDNTPGCTIEAKDFSCLLNEFSSLWCCVVWVSKDSEKSHNNFVEKQELKITLLSDPELILHTKFNVIGEKKNYGKVYQWVIRSTFLLDKDLNIIKEWRNVKAKNHAQKVLDYVKSL